MKKGDVLAVARVAAVMAVKNTAAIIPLCHSGVPVEGVRVDVEVVDAAPATFSSPSDHNDQDPTTILLHAPIPPHGGVRIAVHVETTAKTGIEMEALTGVMGAGLSVVDMCKAVDRGCVLEGVRVVGKKGGRRGGWGVYADEEGGVEGVERKEGRSEGALTEESVAEGATTGGAFSEAESTKETAAAMVPAKQHELPTTENPHTADPSPKSTGPWKRWQPS